MSHIGMRFLTQLRSWSSRKVSRSKLTLWALGHCTGTAGLQHFREVPPLVNPVQKVPKLLRKLYLPGGGGGNRTQVAQLARGGLSPPLAVRQQQHWGFYCLTIEKNRIIKKVELYMKTRKRQEKLKKKKEKIQRQQHLKHPCGLFLSSLKVIYCE